MSGNLLSRVLAVGRVLFVVAALSFAAWGFHGRGEEILRAMKDVSALGLIAACVLTCAGLLATGLVWRLILDRFGAKLSAVDSRAIFFVGQLGKYIPGSVWSFGAQAQAAATHGIAPRTTAASSILFLYLHTCSGMVVVAVCQLLGVLTLSGTPMLWWLGLALCLLLLAPWSVRRLGRLVSGKSLDFSARAWATTLTAMTGAWCAYGAAAVAVAGAPRQFPLLTAAFAAGYVAGVVIVVAPAGLGVREATIIVALASTVGVGDAAAIALVLRLVHTLADVTVAISFAGLRRRRDVIGRSPDTRSEGDRNAP
jgi:uncharacterized membrane protein YbhN (UPF0104 family)